MERYREQMLMDHTQDEFDALERETPAPDYLDDGVEPEFDDIEIIENRPRYLQDEEDIWREPIPEWFGQRNEYDD
jgi:hypothetical protein